MWQLVFESSALQQRLVALFVGSCKQQNNSDFERLYHAITRNNNRWNRRFNKASGV